MRTADTDRKGTQSVRRALQILRIIATGRESGVLLRDIVTMTGLTRPTCHRIAAMLVEEGLVERKERSRRYAIGAQIPHLALARPMKTPLVEVGADHLDRAAREIGDTSFLTIRSKMDTLCIARRIGRFPVQVLALEVGGRRPLGVSSGGMAILSSLEDDLVNQIVEANERRFAEFSIQRKQVLNEIELARKRRYALRTRGLVPGTAAASVALDFGSPETVAAITIAGLRQRLAGRRLDAVIEFLFESKAAIEKRGLDTKAFSA